MSLRFTAPFRRKMWRREIPAMLRKRRHTHTRRQTLMPSNTMDPLSPFAKLPNVAAGFTAALLMIGTPFVGRKSLGRRIHELSRAVAVQIRTTSVMPLPEDASGTRPRIEFAVLMLDATSRHSFELVAGALRLLSPSYFAGRCCIVVTRVDKPAHYAVELREVDLLADMFDVPVFYCDGSNEAQRTSVAGRIVNLLEVAVGVRPVTATVLRSTDHAMVASTIIP